MKSRTVSLAKKGSRMESGNYRTISILPHVSKIFLGIVKEWIKIYIRDLIKTRIK